MAGKKQHTVPACYLANWGINGNNGRKSLLYRYNKTNGLIDEATAESTPKENYFYDIPELKENTRILEEIFINIEGDYAESLRTFISKCIIDFKDRTRKTVDVPLDLKDNLAACFAVQMVRTRMFRGLYEDIYSQLKSSSFGNCIPLYNYEDFKRVHNKSMISFDMINFYANLFLDRKWIVLINHTDIPFFTSDNPIVHHYHGKERHYSDVDKELTYYIPLSPIIAVEIFDKSISNDDMSYFDIFFDLRMPKTYNSSLKVNCTSFLYSNINNFEFIQEHSNEQN